MSRMKTFFIYFICFILLYIFVSIVSYGLISTTYKSVKYDINTELLTVSIVEAKGTFINGYINGIVSNDNEKTEKKFLKIDFFSSQNVLMGTKYIDVGVLDKNEVKEFKSNYKFQDVKYFKVTETNEGKQDVVLKENEKSIIATILLSLLAIKIFVF